MPHRASVTLVLCSVLACAGTAHAGVLVDVLNGELFVGDENVYVVDQAGGRAEINQEHLSDAASDNANSDALDDVDILKRLTNNDPFDVVFRVRNSGGTSEISLVEQVLNRTGRAWSGYQFELGFGEGSQFVRSGEDGLDFDTPDRDAAPNSFAALTLLAHDPDVLRWRGGQIPNGAEPSFFAFAIDIPDAEQVPQFAWLDGDYTFTLRGVTQPVVPEPGTAVLMSLGLAGLLAQRRLKTTSRKSARR